MMMDSNASTDICGIQELNGCEMGGQRPATLLAIGGGGGAGVIALKRMEFIIIINLSFSR
jgi:hypothetical protein